MFIVKIIAFYMIGYSTITGMNVMLISYFPTEFTKIIVIIISVASMSIGTFIFWHYKLHKRLNQPIEWCGINLKK